MEQKFTQEILEKITSYIKTVEQNGEILIGCTFTLDFLKNNKNHIVITDELKL